MSEMIDRVARAASGFDGFDFDAMIDNGLDKAVWRDQARHILKAMRDPTDEMLDRLALQKGLERDFLRSDWMSLIDVALSETAMVE